MTGPATAAPMTMDTKPLRTALGRYATGVAVVTTVGPDGEPGGLTVNSFTSLSLDPPMVLWCLRRAASSLHVFCASSHFAVNVLAADQQPLAKQFASSKGDRWAGVPWTAGQHGLPLLAGSIGRLICRRADLTGGGDHLIVLGHIEDYDVTPGPPLVFHDGDFRSLTG